MVTAKKCIREVLLIFGISAALFLVIDFFLGAKILVEIRKSESFRIQHPTYHHTLRANYYGLGKWGDWTYEICTNAHGFKDRCNAPLNNSKSFDVAFIGDSFTEGIGLPFEQTFVGLIAKEYPALRIANLGVVSYSPAIYLAKLRDLYSKGYRFKHVIVFIDIGDVYDEATAYDLHNESIVVDKGEPYPLRGLRYVRRLTAQNLPLTGEVWVQVRKLSRLLAKILSQEPSSNLTSSAPATVVSHANETKDVPLSISVQSSQTTDAPFIKNIYEGIYLKDYPKSEWTYNTDSSHYGAEGVLGTLEKMKREMQAVHALTKDYGSTLSVGVYPWPGQILHDREESLQVQTWRDFCETRCTHFYNVFPSFFRLIDKYGKDNVVQRYYFAGDAHFNALGNKIVADSIISQGIQ